MEPLHTYQIFIVHPDKGTLVQPEEWAEEKDPTRAQCVAMVDMDTYRGLVIFKTYILNPDGKKGGYVFEDAQRAAGIFSVDCLPGLKFRNPTVRDTFAMFDARYQGLDDAISLIAGAPMEGKTCWTCELDPHPESAAEYAHAFMSWNLVTCKTQSQFKVQPVADLVITGKAKPADKEHYRVMIVNPTTGDLVSPSLWRSQPDPDRAQLLAIVNIDTDDMIVMQKDLLLNPEDPNNGWYDFDGAVEAAESYRSQVLPDLEFRLPTREEMNVIYFMRFSRLDGLDEVLELVGGDNLEDYTVWTCEENPDPEGEDYAFTFSGNCREVNIVQKDFTLSVRPVARTSARGFKKA